MNKTEIDVYKCNDTINSVDDWAEFVRRHRNIFAYKTIRRRYNIGRYYVVKEFSYYDDGSRDVWLWIYDPATKYYCVAQHIDPKKEIRIFVRCVDKLKNI